MVIPHVKDLDDGLATQFPLELEDTLESASQRQRQVIQAEINEFTARKRQEFKSWREQATKEAVMISRIVESISESPISNSALTITPANSKTKTNGAELFQKSPVTQYSHPGASPLAAASLTRSQSERLPTPSPPSKINPPPIPLSSSLKSPGSTNYSKPVKRVMFQDPPDEEVEGPSDVEEVHTDYPSPSTLEPTISVDGTQLLNSSDSR
jgi:hypothetical protein